MTNIIDIHTHAFADDIAPKAINALEKSSNTKAFLDGTVSDLRSSMQRVGIALSVVQPVSTKPSQVTAINNWAKQITGNGIISFGTIYPGQEDWESEIARLKILGLSGVKFHPDYQEFYPDDSSMFPIYEKLAENGLIVLFHAGEDISFSPPFHGTPERISKVVANSPELRVIASHLGGFKMWDEVEEYLVGKELYLDTSYIFGYLKTERIIKIMDTHGFDWIVFGTDSPWKDQKTEVGNISSLRISDEAKEKILGGNAHRLLGLKK